MAQPLSQVGIHGTVQWNDDVSNDAEEVFGRRGSSMQSLAYGKEMG